MLAKNMNMVVDIRQTLSDVHLQLEVLKKEQGPEWPHMKSRDGRYLAIDLLVAKSQLFHSLTLLTTEKKI